ncbi:restriction endonuclease subunit S [Acinetobacter gerneri]|uniref:Restriction endonuclease subunit S n=1 Tax=Acinetobacter gerneri TaxID=202952 RepID=A0AAW8JG31_9GAMM|nr:restriction endonuclease subunit S [Acinetobacter gerneri]MDQ9009742.1 restriction endonuclease subunit S [Acinetobacter gerneri]MDQ9013714.1 restriction endonuclease subunit S [Acinetobacter gerneri]MDQ9025128.1 restriction endonuclease subunit S [Acinetobacter gerneri]MDQ9050891.1 restriction endonuclease subunit S [Acinetobacter gerneri]MDQ9059757.1 restriction endonuclease subunit S [Acinetobacter gerneri]
MSTPKLRFKEFGGDWAKTSLNQITTKIGDGIHATPKYDDNGLIPFINGNNLINGNVKIFDNTKRINLDEFKKYSQKLSEQTIFLSINGTIGNLAFYRNETVLLGKSVCFISLAENVNPNFIYQLLQSPQISKTFNAELTGTTIKNLSLATVRNSEFYYPKKEEQTKIASFLSAVDQKISQLTQKHELLSQYKQGMMQKLFSQQIRFKADDGSEFEEWASKTLDEVANIVGGGTPSTIHEEYWNGDIVWLTPSEINQKFIKNSKRTISELGVQKSSAKKLPVGTVLFTSRATIGEVAITTDELTTNQGFQSFITNDNTLNEFLYYWIIHHKKDFVERASGSTFLEISKSKIQPMQIQLPCPEEQTKIANFLSAIDQKIEVVAQQIKQAKTWKKGLLQQMFV